MTKNTIVWAGVAMLTLLVAPLDRAFAVPYASQVRNTGGDSWEFVLNEAADSITVLRDGGDAVTLTAPAAGRHTFDMTGFSEFEIQVAKDAPAEWTLTSDPSNLHTYYFRPTGVAVNSDPSSPYFGTIYVSNPGERVPNGFTIFDPRAQGEGIYSLSADLISVDLANNFAAQVDPDNVALAKKPASWTTSGNDGSSPWRITLDDSNNLIVADFSDQNGGIKYASPDLTTGGLVLEAEDGVLPLLLDEATGTHEIHGSILSKVSVTGTVGTNLTVWAIDEDYDLDGDTFTDPDGPGGPLLAQQSTYHPLRWDVGAATDYDQAPTVVINKEVISDIADDDMGTPGDTSDDFNDTAYTLSPEAIGGVITNNMHYEEQFDKFYLLQSRSHGNESGMFIVTADGVDGNSPVIEWSSKRFSFDNGLDGNDSTFITDEETGAMAFGDGIQDIFRNIDDVIISPDGSTMYLSRLRQFGPDDTEADGDNPVLGAESNAPGAILVIPLDANGLPDLIIDDNGTPGDTSDDFISNISSIPFDAPGRTLRSQLGLDAAGNVYSVDNLTESLQVFSPGGNTLAITTSAGTFTVTTPSDGLAGDYNGDGMVDATDYAIWRETLGDTVAIGEGADGNGNGVIDSGDFTTWRDNYGASSPGVASTPEPSSLVLLLLTLLSGLVGSRANRTR